jgi:hypothetical protein
LVKEILYEDERVAQKRLSFVGEEDGKMIEWRAVMGIAAR